MESKITTGDYISRMVDEYSVALHAQFTAIWNLVAAERNLETIKSGLLAAAYEDGVIDGKNADLRSAQEKAFLFSKIVFQDANNAVTSARQAVDLAKIEVELAKETLSLSKALLYSQMETK